MNSAVRGLILLGVVSVSAVFGLSMFLENASGDFLELLKVGEAGVRLAALSFIPLGVYLAYKSAK